jgi:hypothetical protein
MGKDVTERKQNQLLRRYNEFKTIILYMRENYCITMAGFLDNFLSQLKKKFPFLDKPYINSDVVLAAMMHLFLLICMIVLLYFLMQRLLPLFSTK